jgi:hypothetical protein
LKAESTLRAEAEENLRLLRSEYEKQIRNLEMQVQKERRQRTNFEEQINILETQLNFLSNKTISNESINAEQQDIDSVESVNGNPTASLLPGNNPSNNEGLHHSTSASPMLFHRQNSYNSFAEYLYQSSPTIRKLNSSMEMDSSQYADTRLASLHPNLLIYGTN